MTKLEFLKWWNSLPEAVRAEIYMKYNPEATDGDWAEWVHYMSEKEMEEVYNENIGDTSNVVDLEDYKSDFLHDKKREIERGI
jgi:hypothetical protein